MPIPLQAGEQILANVGANMFRGMEAVGGNLKITDRRLLFEPHAINFQTTPEEIPVAQIVEVRPRNTLGLVPNGLLVRLQSGTEYKFVVWGRQKLISLIEGLRAKKSA